MSTTDIDGEGADILEGAKVIVQFLAVDKSTVFLVVKFGILYLDDNRKKVTPLYLLLLSLAQVSFQLTYI